MSDYAAIYDPDTDVDRIYTQVTGDRVVRWLRPGDWVLELGCATGAMTAMLAGEHREVVGVDHAESYLAAARARALTGVAFVAADLADGLPVPGRFDHVVCANVLHELDDPGALLAAIAADALTSAGVVHVTLQNPRSLHRLVALEMGLLDDLCEVAVAGHRYATRRLYTAEEFERLAAAAGLEVAHREGLVLKPLPNAAMDALPADVLAGFAAAGRHLPDHCAMNSWVLRRAR